MNDLYSLSQLIKVHPLYNLKRDEIHTIYFQLGRIGRLTVDHLLGALENRHPELFLAIQRNPDFLKRQFEESVRLRLQGVHLVCYGEELFPSQCYQMQEPPLTLSYVGAPAWLNHRSLAVVGSREPAEESIQWMEKQFAVFCEQERPCVISGGARGVDQKAHSLALRKGLATLIVIPSGLGRLYPESLKDWMDPVLAGGGCIVSEYAYEQRMHKHLFHHRNRLIAALGRVTLIVEAKRRSGTLITAQQATQLGRSVWVVPGHPLDPHFGGSLDLVAEGAVLVRDAEDLSINFKSEFGSEWFDTSTDSRCFGEAILRIVDPLSCQNS